MMTETKDNFLFPLFGLKYWEPIKRKAWQPRRMVWCCWSDKNRFFLLLFF